MESRDILSQRIFVLEVSTRLLEIIPTHRIASRTFFTLPLRSQHSASNHRATRWLAQQTRMSSYLRPQ